MSRGAHGVRRAPFTMEPPSQHLVGSEKAIHHLTPYLFQGVSESMPRCWHVLDTPQTVHNAKL